MQGTKKCVPSFLVLQLNKDSQETYSFASEHNIREENAMAESGLLTVKSLKAPFEAPTQFNEISEEGGDIQS